MLKSKSLWFYSVFNLAILIIAGLWFWQQNQAVELPETGLGTDSKLQCVSYAPYYHDGVTPFKIDTHIEPAQIDSDLSLLSKRFDCVRIYSVGQGLDYVPEAARKLGLKVLLGAWIGWLSADNEKELNLAISLANRYPDTIKAMVVGNEVLLRGEQPEAVLQSYINRAKKATKVPVTYADVWEFWNKHKNLEKSVDYITVHVLPYWEDDPQSIDTAIQHANIVMDKLAHNFSKPIFIGETGWPSVGRQRGPSIPSQINQARYLREFIQNAQKKNWNYNLIEAIDQPWKRMSEGTVGGYWGLYDTQLNPKFGFNGLVAERHDGLLPVYWSLAGALILLILGIYVGNSAAVSLLALTSLGAVTGVIAYLQLDYLMTACRDSIEWISLSAISITGLLSVLVIAYLILKGQTQVVHKWLLASLFLICLGAGTTGILLTLDGRYRDFPVVLYLLATLQLSIGTKLLGISTQIKSRIVTTMQITALVTALIGLCLEPQNSHALYWLAITAMLTYTNRNTFLK